MSTTLNVDDAVVIKVAALACMDMLGVPKDDISEFAKEVHTVAVPVDTAMQKVARLRVGTLKPFKTERVDGHFELVYTKDCGAGLHILCAALLTRLFDLLLMPLPDTAPSWGDLQPITTEEMTTIKDLARNIRIENEEPSVH